MRLVNVEKLKDIAEIEFDEIVLNADVIDINELRITLRENSFIEVWFSLKLEGRYSFHWERKAIDGTIYRHDNAPHKRWQRIRTFPKHFHDGSEAEEDCKESYISDDPKEALREMLGFVGEKLAG